MHPVDRIILERLYDRPSWLRSLQHVRPRTRLLIEAGYARRVPPPNGKAKNMVEITEQGRVAIEKYWKNNP